MGVQVPLGAAVTESKLVREILYMQRATRLVPFPTNVDEN